MRTCAYKEQTADTNCWMLSHFIGSTEMLTLWTAGLMKRLVVLNVIGVINWVPCAVLWCMIVYHVDSFVGQSLDCSLWKGHISRLLLGLQSTLNIVDTIGTSTYSVLFYRESLMVGVYFAGTSLIYFCLGFSCCPYYWSVHYSWVSARRELTVFLTQFMLVNVISYPAPATVLVPLLPPGHTVAFIRTHPNLVFLWHQGRNF